MLQPRRTNWLDCYNQEKQLISSWSCFSFSAVKVFPGLISDFKNIYIALLFSNCCTISNVDDDDGNSNCDGDDDGGDHDHDECGELG